MPVIDLLNAFLGGPAAVGSAHGVTGTAINNTINLPGINSMITQQNTQSNASPTKPRAFINVVFFDEQFKSYEAGFSISMVGSNSVVKDHYSELQNLIATKSGYVYIYCSNESPVNVFFDNLQVLHTRSPILEETHYYPFGLTMAGISSNAAGELENKRKFTSQEMNLDLGLNWYEFRYRMQDPQIGRFLVIDPLSDSFPHNSTFAYAENDVIRSIDLEGLEKLEITAISPLIGIGSRTITPMKMLELKYDFNSKNISLTAGETGQKALQATYNTITKDVGANSFDLLASNVMEKYGQVGSSAPPLILDIAEFSWSSGLATLFPEVNSAVQELDNILHTVGVDMHGDEFINSLIGLVNDKKVSFQILDAPEEVKVVTNADGSKLNQLFKAGTIYRGFLQTGNSAIIFQYTDQKEGEQK